MKIVCQSCSAKYSIADDKVQGKKVFKFKCKKCGSDIVARGSEGGASGETDLSASHVAQDPFGEEEATRIGGPPGAAAAAMAAAMAEADGVWHAVVNGDQKGPFSIAQLQDMLASKTITAETFVWRDGFGDWKPMKEVSELASIASSKSGGGADLFGGASSGGDALFGGDGKGKGAGGSGEAKARPGSKASSGSDLFGESSGSSGGPFGDNKSAADSSASSASATGARNENSVLFSLASLQQVAGAGGKDEKKESADKSGLIDLKSPSSSKKGVDDILTIAPAGGLGSGPLVNLAPVATPVSDEPAKQQGGNKSMLIALIAVAVIIAGGGIAAVMIFKKDTPPAQAQPAAPPQPQTPAFDQEAFKRDMLAQIKAQNGAGGTPAANAMTADDLPLLMDMVTALNAGKEPPAKPAAMDAAHYDMLLAQAKSKAKPTTVATNDTTPNTGSSTGSSGSRPRSSGSSTPSSGSTGTPSTTAHTDSRPSTTTTPSSSAGSCAERCRGNVACLLGCTGTGSTTRPTTPSTTTTTPRPTTPTPTPTPAAGSETPQRNDIVNAMNGVRASVMRCASGQAGTAMVAVTFSGSSGRVTSANVSGAPFAGSPAGSCIATAVRSAHVPPFTRPTFSVTYPFAIH